MAKVEKLEDYISIIKNLYAMEGCGALRKIYYRGQSDSAYKLIPSLSHKLEGYVEDEDNYIAFEKDIIERAKLEYPDVFADNNIIDELALMQHYGLPTRLMDVTENPLVALYFACKGNEERSGEVFVFVSGLYAQTYTSYEAEQMIKGQKPAFVRAKSFSNRQRAQQGLFMWFPDDKLEEITKSKDENPVILETITIPADNKGIILEELKMIGISAKSLFPDNIDICLKEMLKDVTKGAYSA